MDSSKHPLLARTAGPRWCLVLTTACSMRTHEARAPSCDVYTPGVQDHQLNRVQERSGRKEKGLHQSRRALQGNLQSGNFCVVPDGFPARAP